MGYFIVKYHRFTALLGNGGYFIVNTKKWYDVTSEIEDKIDYSQIDRKLSKYKFNPNMPIGLQRSTYYNLSNYPSKYIALSAAQQKFPEILAYEKSKYENGLKKIKPIDCNFFLDAEAMSNVGDSLSSIFSIFFINSKLFDFDFDQSSNGFRLIQKPQGLASFFSGKKSGETLIIQTFNEISKIKITPDIIEIYLKSQKKLLISRDGPYFEN